MRFLPTSINGVILIEPDIHRDNRGFFLESYHEKKYKEGGIEADFSQDCHSKSIQDTVRGLHAQLHHPQGKLVRATQGEIFDVAVDARPHSPTFGRWVSEKLSGENFRQLFVPPGFLHGFCVLSPWAEVEYKCSGLYDPADEIGVFWGDTELRIQWPVTHPSISERDKALPSFNDMKTQFEAYRSLPLR